MYFELTLKKNTHICHFKDGSDEKTCTPGVEQKDLFTDEHIRERGGVTATQEKKKDVSYSVQYPICRMLWQICVDCLSASTLCGGDIHL